ncbi:hypothetical protein DYB32_010702 [Aphanomyces invadans]|uniref:Uncharacterized protein n=1 Tax=Aphanomyces invadans TaxID=157072 RepID=A0A3R6VDG0_9STRA|nr:hypothetical protein DYB32_010702 [Aphanomyces invadans]
MRQSELQEVSSRTVPLVRKPGGPFGRILCRWRFAICPPGLLGANAAEANVTSQVIQPTPQRIHHRASDQVQDDDASDSSSDALTPPPKKQKKQLNKRDRRSAGAVIGDAISKLVEVEASKATQATDPHDRVTLAIDCLMEHYSHLDGMAIAALADLMGQGFNATIFMALRGEARDAWVLKNSM